MLRKMILGFVVIALLAGCAGLALPETLSRVTAEDSEFDVHWEDTFALEEESYGEGIVGPAVPVPVERGLTMPEYWEILSDLEPSSRIEPAVPAPVDRELTPTLYWEILSDLEPSSLNVEPAVPAPVDRELTPTLYWETIIDFETSSSNVEPAVPAPVEAEYELLPDELTLIEPRPPVAENIAAVPAPVEVEYELLPDELTLIEPRPPAVENIEPGSEIIKPAVPTGGTWGPSYEDGFALPVLPVPTEDTWMDGDVIIGYGPTDFNMPRPPLRMSDLATGGAWGPSYEDGFALPVLPVSTGQRWGPSYEDGFALPVLPAPTVNIWMDGDVIIGYGPTDFNMPRPPLRMSDLATGGVWGPSYEDELALPVSPVSTGERWGPSYQEYLQDVEGTFVEPEIFVPITP